MSYDIDAAQADGAQEPFRIAFFAPYLDDRRRHVDGCGLAWDSHTNALPENIHPFGCPADWRDRRIAELRDLIGDADACGDGDCPCKQNLSDYRDELEELSA